MSAVVDSVVPLDRSARLYGHKIARAWQKSVEGVLEAGALLVQAKADLPHGEFERMVAKSCPFGIRTAQMLMRIAENPVLPNTNHGSCLPASWRTLYELAKFEPPELSHALGNHWVKPEMTREDVGNLHRRVKKALGKRGREPARRAKPWPFAALLRAAMPNDLVEALMALPADQVQDIVRNAVDFIEKEAQNDASSASPDVVEMVQAAGGWLPAGAENLPAAIGAAGECLFAVAKRELANLRQHLDGAATFEELQEIRDRAAFWRDRGAEYHLRIERILGQLSQPGPVVRPLPEERRLAELMIGWLDEAAEAERSRPGGTA